MGVQCLDSTVWSMETDLNSSPTFCCVAICRKHMLWVRKKGPAHRQYGFNFSFVWYCFCSWNVGQFIWDCLSVEDLERCITPLHSMLQYISWKYRWPRPRQGSNLSCGPVSHLSSSFLLPISCLINPHTKKMDLASLLFINLTAAATHRDDLYCQEFIFCNADCYLKREGKWDSLYEDITMMRQEKKRELKFTDLNLYVCIYISLVSHDINWPTIT